MRDLNEVRVVIEIACLSKKVEMFFAPGRLISCIVIFLTKLPFHHRDPFDRMLIAQAKVEDLQLLSRDDRYSAYKMTRIW